MFSIGDLIIYSAHGICHIEIENLLREKYNLPLIKADVKRELIEKM